jgi:hypothetical protein
MSILAFFAGIGAGFAVSALWDQYKMYKRNAPKSGKVGSYDSEGRYYEE